MTTVITKYKGKTKISHYTKSGKRICSACHQRKLYYRNGLPLSKYCNFCKKQKELEKKAKHLTTKGAQEGLRKKLHKKAWKKFSEFVRKLNADSNGMIKCFTCDTVVHWKEANACHRYHNRLDFDLLNVHEGCVKCNQHLHGNLGEYERRLVKKYGQEVADSLERRANLKGNNYTIEELEDIITTYEQKLKELDETSRFI